MRRTVTLEIELDGPIPNALDLRDAVLRVRPGSLCKVVRVEVLDDGVIRRGPRRVQQSLGLEGAA